MTERNDDHTRRPEAPETDPSGDISTSPANDWDREQWPGQNQPGRDQEARVAEDEVTGHREHWNAHEFVGEGQGGPDEGPTGDDPTVEGENAYSGHGHNPGGGERWADVDRG